MVIHVWLFKGNVSWSPAFFIHLENKKVDKKRLKIKVMRKKCKPFPIGNAAHFGCPRFLNLDHFACPRVLNSAQFADLGRGDTQNYMDLGSGTRKMICIKNDNMNLCFVWNHPKFPENMCFIPGLSARKREPLPLRSFKRW